MKKLSDPQRRIMDYIVDFTREHAYPPSVREICEGVGLSSTSTVHTHLKNLESKGLIERDRSKQRSIRVAEEAEPYAAGVPLLGRVAAGTPVLAVENMEDCFPLPDLLTHGTADETFMLRVDGDSMIEAGIQHGDILVVQHRPSCENGDIVVARVQDESVTVKRLYREQGCVRLQPENALYEPIRLPYEDVEIVGKVIGLMRSLR
ncbi:MAG: transcriptional repressor LexA [Clostridia bacterium]|nr:transcriptional repressor LexA [Clostridia bacterium]